MKSQTLKRFSITVATAIVLGAISYVAWQGPAGSQLETAAETGLLPLPEPEVALATDTAALPAGDTPDPRSTQPDAPDPENAPAEQDEVSRALREMVTMRNIPHDIPFHQIKQELWEDIQENPPELLDRGDPLVDAELAYRIYTFYGNCSTTPRTPAGLDRSLEQMAMHTQRLADRRVPEQLEHIESHIDRMVGLWQLCQVIPQDVDPKLEAVLWMTEAVHLGHEIAQVQFYEKAMGFLLRPDYLGFDPPVVMNHSGLIESFKVTADYGLSQGMKKGHPEAYLAMSQAMMHGIVYPKDPILAYAYLRTAEMKAAEEHWVLQRAEFYKEQMADYLSHEQLVESEKLALGLWKDSQSSNGD